MKHLSKASTHLLAYITMVAVLAAAYGCASPVTESPQAIVTVSPSAEIESREQPSTVDYTHILEEYRVYAEAVNRGELGDLHERYNEGTDNDEEWDHWVGLMLYACLWDPKEPVGFGYALKDLNGDGNPELILMLEDYTIFGIYTAVDGEPRFLQIFWPRYRCAILDSGLLHTKGSNSWADWEYAIERLSQDGRELIIVDRYGSSTEGETEWNPGYHYYKIVDGVKVVISEGEFDEHHKAHLGCAAEYDAAMITKNAGIAFTPLFD